MSLTQALIAEIVHESASTKKILERVPEDKFDWSPHEKSMSLKKLATHIASLAGMPGYIAGSDYLDFAEGKFRAPEIASTADLVKAVDDATAKTIHALKAIKDEDLNVKWTLRHGEHVIVEAPKGVAIRTMGLNHLYHHRGQLSVYLRLLNVPVPGMYGPSADDRASAK